MISIARTTMRATGLSALRAGLTPPPTTLPRPLSSIRSNASALPSSTPPPRLILFQGETRFPAISMNKAPMTPPEEQEELVHADDRIIGLAARRSSLVLLAILLVGGFALLVLKRKPAAKPSQVTKIAAPIAPARSDAEIPVARFTDVSKAS